MSCIMSDDRSAVLASAAFAPEAIATTAAGAAVPAIFRKSRRLVPSSVFLLIGMSPSWLMAKRSPSFCDKLKPQSF